MLIVVVDGFGEVKAKEAVGMTRRNTTKLSCTKTKEEDDLSFRLGNNARNPTLNNRTAIGILTSSSVGAKEDDDAIGLMGGNEWLAISASSLNESSSQATLHVTQQHKAKPNCLILVSMCNSESFCDSVG